MYTGKESFHENPEIVEISKKLAKYGLGIFYPHKHIDNQIVELPPSEIISEKDLTVRFVQKNETDKNAIAVGWRWNGAALVVCSDCCVAYSPPSPPPPRSADT